MTLATRIFEVEAVGDEEENLSRLSTQRFTQFGRTQTDCRQEAISVIQQEQAYCPSLPPTLTTWLAKDPCELLHVS
jgi:hypothetical protein